MEVGKNNTTSLDNATTTGQVRHRDSAISTADAEKDDSDADGGDTRFGTHCVDDYNVMAENEPPISADEWKKRVSGKRYKRIMNEITKENEKEMKECLSEYWNERTIWPMFLCIGFVVGFIVLLYMSGTMSYFNGRVAGSHWIDAMEDFNERLQQIKAEERPFPDREDVENWRKCLDDKDFLGLIMRRECNIQWMLRLALGKVKSFGKVFDVRKQGLKKGGYENKLTTNVTSYFKTCLSSQAWGSESFESEIIAFHLDRLTGIYRTLPVVGRSFNYEDLRHVADTTHHRAAQHSLRTAREFCPGSNGKTIPGAMVGWSHFQIQHTHDKMLPALLFDLQHQRRHFAADQTILSTTVDAIDATIHCFHAHRGYFSVAQMRQTLWSQSKPFDEFKDPSDPCYGVSHSDVLASLIAMENVRSAIHDVLTGWYDRPDHNIFEVRSGNGRGPFALIDNDRTQYSSSLVFPAYVSAHRRFLRDRHHNHNRSHPSPMGGSTLHSIPLPAEGSRETD
eukprot:TRINITY_DN2929_c0_g1_i2.p1 TRINITY_DN2929_c0_g1~~TRINITY_DN2929_c0_g1_i2.p1  ORF type:complete len:508 (+),score=64.79 TRINITY_DN2929_c0_g1_i2:313-1836(+)